MTLQLRPTFSESWYRVKNLRAKLRPGAQISRQYYRGDRWYVVRDPAGNQFHRLSDPAYRFVALLDGSRTVEEAWDLCGGQLADDAPTQPEVIQILSHLFGANLIDADVTPDATVLLRRHKQQKKRKMQGRLMQALFPRIPLWDPDRFLVRWMPLVRGMISKFGALVWLAVVIAAIVAVAQKTQSSTQHDLTEAAKYAINLHTNTINIILLWGMFVFTKLIHELGHAFSCRRFGGECHELGIMFLVFIPTPYVDASSAWSFPNKWHRVFVGAGGMIVELFFAALCAFIWINVDPRGVIGQLAFNAMLVASVTTVIFNANPLLRYDGYYILSDFLEIPNLRQKSVEYTMGLIKRHLFRVKARQPLPPPLQRVYLFLYAVSSTIYRTFIGIMIILLVAFQVPVLGILMAVGGIVTWLFVPIFKTFKYLAIDPELHRKRGRATAYTIAFVTAVVILIGFIRFPLNLDQVGMVEPANKDVVHTGAAGEVIEVYVKDGQPIAAGAPILKMRSPELEARILKAQADLAAYQLRRNALVVEDPSGVTQVDNLMNGLRREIAELERQQKALIVTAPRAGYLFAPQLADMRGKLLGMGDPIARIDSYDKLMVRVLADQKDAEPIIHGMMRRGLRELRDETAAIVGELETRQSTGRMTAPEMVTLRDRTVIVARRLDALPYQTTDGATQTALLQMRTVSSALNDAIAPPAATPGTQPASPPIVRAITAAREALASLDGATNTVNASIRQTGGPDTVDIEVRFAGDIGTVHKGGPPSELGAARTEGFDPALMAGAGQTEVQADMRDPQKTQTPQFDIGVPLDNPGGRYYAGQRAYVRFKLDEKPLLWQWSRRFWQLITAQHSEWI